MQKMHNHHKNQQKNKHIYFIYLIGQNQTVAQTNSMYLSISISLIYTSILILILYIIKINNMEKQPTLQQMELESQDQSEQQQKVTYAGKKNPQCTICSSKVSKYKCPKCGLQTCSLFCSKKHKDFNNCNGIKVLNGYYPKNQMEENNIKNDYKFLVNMIDGVDRVRKSLTGILHCPQQMRFKLLKNNAYKQSKIELKIAPNVIQRHRQNISFFFMKTKQIYWVFQLIYIYQGHKNQRFVTDPICNKEKITNIFNQQFLSTQMLTKDNINTCNLKQFKILVKNTYNYKKLEDPNHLAVGKQSYGYIEIDRQEIIDNILSYMNIHEFPTLYLLHKTFVNVFSMKNKVYVLPTLN